MAPLPYTSSGANPIFGVLVGAFVLLEVFTRLRTRKNGRGAPEEWRSFVAVIGSIYLGFAAAFLAASELESLAIGFARWPVFVLGAVLTATGIALRQWAIAVLGESFTVEVRVKPGQAVVEDGPYRWVAHPFYTGMIFVFVGIGLMLGNWISLACMAVIPMLGLIFRIRTEEGVLIAGIGESYRRFLATRARLLPGVW
ncbi:MAG TPA: isoprenylcysteine carboxylmethyltransferase family protein [Solirubrobacteraceae bacterium]|nr:isoprenylcysteine carboxylmethyltransferase family protein [Solirubrobacteraceae bacterium]